MSLMSERVVPLGKEYKNVEVSCWNCDAKGNLSQYGADVECESCKDAYLDFDDRTNKELPHPAWSPTMGDVHRWVDGSENAMALDECEVEPDGHCEHGSPSWLLHLGLM